MTNFIDDASIPTLTVPSAKKPVSSNGASSQELNALKSMYTVKVDQMKLAYDELEFAAKAEKEALEDSFQDKLKALRAEHQTQLESLHSEFQAQLENVHVINRKKLESLEAQHQEALKSKKNSHGSSLTVLKQQLLKQKQENMDLVELQHQQSQLVNDLKLQLQSALSAESYRVEGLADADQPLIQRIKQLADRVALLEVELNYRNEQLTALKL